MNITIYINENGDVTLTDFPEDLIKLVSKLNDNFFTFIEEKA